MKKLQKLKKGDKVAILSPSSAGPAIWPHVYDLGVKRLQEVFELRPVEFPTTKKLGATGEERSKDWVDAFENKEIKAIISSIGGDDQVTYVKNLPPEPFAKNPKPFFGYSDNTHMMNFLWLQGVPSYYGGALLTQFAMQKEMDEYTVKYLKYALFEEGEFEIEASEKYNDVGLNWGDPSTLNQKRINELNERWFWEGNKNVDGITWGGCLESLEEILKHNIPLPTLEEFENIVLMTETSEGIPSSEYVAGVYRTLGEMGVLARIKAVLVGRPKAWEFDKQKNMEEKTNYRKDQREAIIKIVRTYNPTVPIVQNLDFGHTDPQIPMPYGMKVRINSSKQKIFATF